ncbi:MAG: GxxExxY protein [Butyricimonas faecihominis]
MCLHDVKHILLRVFLRILSESIDNRIKRKGIHADTETPINVYYKMKLVGEFRADIIVEGKIIIELKAVQHLLPIHETQLVNYLTATNTDHGLLINFGGERIEIKRKFREYKHI